MIQLDDLCFSYGGRTVLHNISATFSPGKLYAVLGPNGSGKTTLIRLLSRLLLPDSGSLTLDGKSFACYGRKEFARQLALLPQTRPIPAISVQDLVSHGRFPYLGLSRTPGKSDLDAVERAMAAVNVLDFAGRDLRQLSGGERQRVYLALLLAQDTRYVLLDEPTTYLDASAQFSVMENLKRMSQDGKCVIAVLHDLNLALSFSDEICLLDQGRIAAFGPPEALVEQGLLDRVFSIRCRSVVVDGIKEYIIRPGGV
ncbi:MAG: ABC transporter ATP-binding protein [Candidatus Limivicinus sp.]